MFHELHNLIYLHMNNDYHLDIINKLTKKGRYEALSNIRQTSHKAETQSYSLSKNFSRGYT